MSLWPVFFTVLFAELGDKTQLATLLFAADPQVSRVGVFCASAGALVLPAWWLYSWGDSFQRLSLPAC